MADKNITTEFSSQTPVGTFRLRSVRMHVMKVLDGNTIGGTLEFRRWGLRKVKETVTIRLNGIKCPELHIQQAGQEPDEFSVEATQYVKQQIEGKRVKVVAARKYNGELIRENHNNVRLEPSLVAFVHPTFLGMKRNALNVRLVRKGFAWRSLKPQWMTKQYHQQLLKAEKAAKRQRTGVWRNYTSDTESTGWKFWLGFLLGILFGFAASFLWFFYT